MTTTKTRKKVLFRLMAVSLSIVVVLFAIAFADIVMLWARIRFSPGQSAEAKQRYQDMKLDIFNDSPGGLRYKRFLDRPIIEKTSGRRVQFRTNSLGFRGPAISLKEKGEVRILCLGDSITSGLYVEEEETIPAALERQLSPALDDKKIIVINGAVHGACLREYLLILTETGLFTQPDIVVVNLYLNDANEAKFFGDADGFFGNTEIGRQLRMQKLMKDLGDETRELYESISGKPFPAEEYPEGAWRTDRKAFEVELAKNTVPWGSTWFDWAWDKMGVDLEAIADLCRRNDIQPVICLFPVINQVEADFLDDTPQEYCRKIADKLDVRFIDLLPVLRAEYQKSGKSLAYDECHLRPFAHEIVAKEQARQLLPLLKPTSARE